MKFDLNIENYKTEELIDIFELPINYDKKIIEIQTIKLVENILTNKSINKESKDRIIKFLNKAKDLILDNLKLKKTKIISSNNNTHLIQQKQKTTYVELNV